MLINKALQQANGGLIFAFDGDLLMKCSQCGPDVPAVHVQYSWKQLLLIVPILL